MSKKTISALSVVDAVLLAAAAFSNLLAIYLGIIKHSFTAYDYIISVLLVMTAFFAVFYLLAGCKKAEGAAYFKGFMNVYAVLQLAGLLQHQRMTVCAVLLTAVSFACLAVLSVSKDLGRAKSFLLAGIVAICALVQLVACVVSGSFESAWFGVVTLALLAASSLLMVAGKYADKVERGRNV